MASLLRLADGRRAGAATCLSAPNARQVPHVWSKTQPKTLQTRETYLTFGAKHNPKPSKRETSSPRLEQNTTQNPPNARKVSHIWRAWFNIIAAEHNCKAYYSAAASSVDSSVAASSVEASPLNFAKQASLSAIIALKSP